MMYATLEDIMHNLEKAAPIQWTMTMQQQLGKIVVAAIELSHLLQRQAARFEVRMAGGASVNRTGIPFDHQHAEDLGDGMEEVQSALIIGMAVFPGIFKWGDERGENVST